jgi:hypothetical protein
LATEPFVTTSEKVKHGVLVVGGPAVVWNPVVAIAWPVLGLPPKYWIAPAFEVVTGLAEMFVMTTVGFGVDPSKFQYASVPDDVTDPGVLPAAHRQRS